MQTVPLMATTRPGDTKRVRRRRAPRTFAEFLDRRLKELGMTITELSFRTRLPERQLRAYRSGANDPGVTNLAPIMAALGDPLPWGETDSRKSSTAREISLAEWMIRDESSALVSSWVGR